MPAEGSEKMKISVIGAGSWGTTLANLLAENNPDKDVFLWAREKEVAESIEKERKNKLFLPNINLSTKLKPTNSLAEAVKNADLLVIVVPSQFLREKARDISGHIGKNVTVVNAAKGMEVNTFKRMSEILREEIPDSKIAVLSGPNHAEEVSKRIPTATVIASKEADLDMLKDLFETDYFKVYPHDDVIGVEICAAVKNITAIATGVIDALGMGDNAHGAIITLGLREMVKVGKHFGAKESTFYGLSGVGDLVATCTSRHSRNRKAGNLIAKGYDFEKIKEEMHGMVAEGIMTCKALHEYAVKNDISLVITSQAYKVLFEKKALEEAIKDLKKLI
ncbi:NAD(P)H-dependent glycerol-3-phosphate dehydrogenase [Candidatus Woesearchaeota archaeon]|nr:NAD(P)H-dependent glycerol-3-phosphate dehydrogenase [Candidatus Woesearchaeota archaeon]